MLKHIAIASALISLGAIVPIWPVKSENVQTDAQKNPQSSVDNQRLTNYDTSETGWREEVIINDGNRAYIPPHDSLEQKRANELVSRNQDTCAKEVRVVELIPNHVPNTISDSPSFLYYFSKIPDKKVLLSISEPKVIEPLFEEEITIERSGIIEIKPTLAKQLVENKYYVVSLTIVCNQKRPSKNKYIRYAFKRVPKSAQLESALSSVDSESAQAEVLAKQGIWLEALASAYSQFQQSKQKPKNTYFQVLLEEVGLSDIGKIISSGIARIP